MEQIHKHFISSLKQLHLKKSLPTGIWYFMIFFIFYVNTFHEKYPDEFDNILGGWYILHGILPFSGFFSHHGPVPYFLAAIIELFTGRSFVHFRIGYAIILFLLTVLPFLYLKKSLGVSRTRFYAFVITIIAIAATYFWGHMLIADSIAGFFILPAATLVLVKMYYGELFAKNDFIFISLLGFLILLTSLTYLYLIFFFYIFIFIYQFVLQKRKLSYLVKPAIVIVFPFIIYALYLLVTGSIKDYIYQSIIFNQKYYIYNYDTHNGTTSINPIRFSISIANTFFSNYRGLLLQVKDLNLSFPFNISLAICDTVLFLFFLAKRKFLPGTLLLLLIIFANARSNPLESRETDYQSATYIMISFFAAFFVMTQLKKSLDTAEVLSEKIFAGFLLVLISFYGFFNILFLFNKFADKAYGKYMGTKPLIYDSPRIAPLLNKFVGNNDYVWVGPLEFEELYYLNGKLASKYHILIPGMGKSEKIQTEFIADLQKNKPKIIYFDKYFGILGQVPQNYAQYFTSYLNQNYVTLVQLADKGRIYKSVIPVNNEIDLEGELYILKEKQQEVIQQLTDNDLIKEQ